jgi:hypothetical protein
MRAKFNRTAIAIAVALGPLALGAAFATPATLPPVQKSGTVEFMSGGIGQDESRAIEMASREWPLTLEFAAKDQHRSDFAAEVNVVIRDAKGHTLLQTASTGPFVLARLTPGRYDVEATLGGRTLHETVVIGKGQPAKALFLWPTEVVGQHS